MPPPVCLFPPGCRDLIGHFADLADPRIERAKKHRFDHIFVVALCGSCYLLFAAPDAKVFAECFGRWMADLGEPHGVRRRGNPPPMSGSSRPARRWI